MSDYANRFSEHVRAAREAAEEITKTAARKKDPSGGAEAFHEMLKPERLLASVTVRPSTEMPELDAHDCQECRGR
jgi:hypothetical protein